MKSPIYFGPLSGLALRSSSEKPSHVYLAALSAAAPALKFTNGLYSP